MEHPLVADTLEDQRNQLSFREHHHPRSRVMYGIAIAASLLLGACGSGVNQRSEAAYSTTVVDSDDSTPDTIASSSTPTPNTIVSKSAHASAHAARLNPPEKIVCSGEDGEGAVVIYGTSIDTSLNLRFAPVWSDYLAQYLNDQPDIEGVSVINYASPGSTIIRETVPGGGEPYMRLITQLQDTLDNFSDEELSNITLLIHPNIAEFQDKTRTDQEVVDLAVAGMLLAIQIALDKGVEIENIVIFPTDPVVAEVAEELQQLHTLNKRIQMFNERMRDLNLYPKTMPISVLADPVTQNGIFKYFDDFKNQGPIMTGTYDGEHPDPEGHARLVQAIAALPELRNALAASCAA